MLGIHGPELVNAATRCQHNTLATAGMLRDEVADVVHAILHDGPVNHARIRFKAADRCSEILCGYYLSGLYTAALRSSQSGVHGTAIASKEVGLAGQRECTLYDTQMPVSAELCSATSSFEKIRASMASSLAATSSALHCAVDKPQPSCCSAWIKVTESGGGQAVRAHCCATTRHYLTLHKT